MSRRPPLTQAARHRLAELAGFAECALDDLGETPGEIEHAKNCTEAIDWIRRLIHSGDGIRDESDTL